MALGRIATSAGQVLVLTLLACAGPGPADAASTVPAEIKRYWLDPVAAFARENSMTLPDILQIRQFRLTSFHRALLKKCVFAWDPTEIGAPRLDPAQPLGEPDLNAQLSISLGRAKPGAFKITPAHQRTLARSYVTLNFALGVLLEHGTLAPGLYTPRNVSSAALREQMRQSDGTLMPPEDLALTSEGAFAFAEQHRTLLKSLVLDWPSRSVVEELLAAGTFPGPSVDPKRPYGTRASHQIDMALILNDRAALQKTGNQWSTAAKPERHYRNLHRQMLFALQVFAENAEMDPGIYTWARP